MAINKKGPDAYLHGDMNHFGVTQNIINSLAAPLQKIASCGEKKFRIDCRMIRSSDSNGLKLLHVWMQCARFRGVEPVLVNLPDSLKQDMRRVELGNSF